ncbi:MAG: hypothetical protein ABIH00_03730 [Armatimonadota bacterium]
MINTSMKQIGMVPNYTKEVSPALAYSDTKEVVNTSSAAITSSHFFAIKLSELLGELEASKKRLVMMGAQKEYIEQADKFIETVKSYFNTVISQRNRLNQIHWDLKGLQAKAMKPSDVTGASSDAMKACDDYIQKLAFLRSSFHKAFNASQGEEKEVLKGYLEEVRAMYEKAVEMKGALSMIH